MRILLVNVNQMGAIYSTASYGHLVTFASESSAVVVLISETYIHENDKEMVLNCFFRVKISHNICTRLSHYLREQNYLPFEMLSAGLFF